MKKIFYILLLTIMSLCSVVFFVNAEEVDTDKPEIVNLSVKDNCVVRDSEISFNLVDFGSGLSQGSFKFYVNNKEEKDLSIVLMKEGNGISVRYKKAHTLPFGFNELKVEVSDFKNNKLEYSWTVINNPEIPIAQLKYNSDVILGSVDKIIVNITPIAYRTLTLKLSYDISQVEIKDVKEKLAKNLYERIDPVTGEIEIIVNSQKDEELGGDLFEIEFMPLIKGEISIDVLEFSFTPSIAPTNKVSAGVDKLLLNSVDEYNYSTFLNVITMIDENNILAYLDLYNIALSEYKKYNIDLITNQEVKVQIAKMEKCINKYNEILNKLAAVDEQADKVEFLIRGGKNDK